MKQTKKKAKPKRTKAKRNRYVIRTLGDLDRFLNIKRRRERRQHSVTVYTLLPHNDWP